MPFGPYRDFNDCTSKNNSKENPEAYCASVHKKITGKWPTEKSIDVWPKEQFELQLGMPGQWYKAEGDIKNMRKNFMKSIDKSFPGITKYLEKQVPRTDEERRKRHKERFGTEELPPRGTGLEELGKQIREPYAVATAAAEKMGYTDFSEGSEGRKQRDKIAEAIEEKM